MSSCQRSDEHDPFAASVTCDECPWRTDVPPGQFPPERFIALAETAQQGFGPMFSCHKTTDEAQHACVGWLLVDAEENLTVRLAAARGLVSAARLRARGPLYGSFGEMAEANGVPAAVVDDLGVRSARRARAIEGRQTPLTAEDHTPA